MASGDSFLARPTPYWFILRVHLHEGQEIEEDGSRSILVGYFCTLGISAASVSDAKAIAQSAVTDGEIDWSASEWNVVDPSTLDSAVQERSGDSRRQGVWYRSGNILYSDESN